VTNPSGAAGRLLDAIENNDIAIASSIIESGGGANLNSTPSPLHCAARLGRVEIMTLLLDAGADINAVNEAQRNSLVTSQFARSSLMRSNCSLTVVRISLSSLPRASSLLESHRASQRRH
jgi:ankyrin repeat protein